MGECKARRRSVAAQSARLHGSTCFPRTSLKASGKGNCHCRACRLLFMLGARQRPGAKRVTGERRPRAQALAGSRQGERVRSPRRHGAMVWGARRKIATARTVCLLAGRRLGKGSGCPAGQAAKRFEDRLLLLSKASAPLRRRANSSLGKNTKSTKIAKQSRDSILKVEETPLKEIGVCGAVAGRPRVYAFFTCFFICVPNTIRPVIAKESSVDACSSSGSPMPASAGSTTAR